MRYTDKAALMRNLEAEITYLKKANAALEAAKPVIAKWDGRKVTKRLNTALEKVAAGLSIRRGVYIDSVEIRYFDYDARHYSDGTHTGYVSRECEEMGEIYDGAYNRPINAQEWTDAINRAIFRNTEKIHAAEYLKENAAETVEQYNAAVDAFEAARDAIPLYALYKLLEDKPYLHKMSLY